MCSSENPSVASAGCQVLCSSFRPPGLRREGTGGAGRGEGKQAPLVAFRPSSPLAMCSGRGESWWEQPGVWNEADPGLRPCSLAAVSRVNAGAEHPQPVRPWAQCGCRVNRAPVKSGPAGARPPPRSPGWLADRGDAGGRGRSRPLCHGEAVWVLPGTPCGGGWSTEETVTRGAASWKAHPRENTDSKMLPRPAGPDPKSCAAIGPRTGRD